MIDGAGKTTTIRILNGVLSATHGRATVLGLDPGADGPEVRARTGVLTETPSLDERLTARENLSFAAQLFGVPGRLVAARVDELLRRFELSERADDRTAGFSRGMKQRLALARAVVHDPELLFLDEPTAALDPVAARDVHELIRCYAGDDGRTVVLTTHNLVEAQRLCDRVVILRRGRSIAQGTTAELARQLSAAGRVEIDVGADDVDVALGSLRSLLDDAAVEVEGETLLVEGVGRHRLPELVSALTGAGVSVFRVMPGEPSLEDVYFALHAEDEA
ncbi:MAG TPA: ABC transporter ATP-binding protein [Candidatus Limnocylindria bacterium]|nr:ABC transporter ATP-binding protein [Candidatus Limnocylindria bacterium]